MKVKQRTKIGKRAACRVSLALQSLKLNARALDAHCTSKIRHQTRTDARIALNSTIADRDEEMAPYPCKFCKGWHNGHKPVDRFREFEPVCVCGHAAMTHESFIGLGCFECSCLVHREWIYRKAIRTERKAGAEQLRQRRRISKVLRTAIVLLPGWLAARLLDALQRRARDRRQRRVRNAS